MRRRPAQAQWGQSFTLSYQSVLRPPLDFKSECRELALTLAREAHGLPIYVCVSGGVDGEVVCRSFMEAGLSFQPVVFEYRKHIREDLAALRAFIKKQGLSLKTVPFDEEAFLRTEIHQWTKRFAMSEPFVAFDMARIERLDGAVVMGAGDILLEPRPQGLVSNERGAHFQVQAYMDEEKRPGCYQFFQGSAEVMLAFLNETIIKKWIELQNEMGFSDSRKFKSYLYKKLWPDLALRKKWTGYERFAGPYLQVQHEMQKLHPPMDQFDLPLENLRHQLEG